MTRKEEVQPKRVIIEKNSVTALFTTDENGQIKSCTISGRTVDGRGAIFLADGNNRKAQEGLARLRQDNPEVEFHLSKSLSPFASRGIDQLITVLVKVLSKAMTGESELLSLSQVGQHRLNLAGLMPIANVGWRGIWAITDRPLSEIKIDSIGVKS